MFEITKREVLVSISIIAIMLLFGVLISGRIADWQMDKNEIYNKAVKIDSTEMFEYGMRTNVGNAFVYGDLKAVDTVTYPEIGGEYMYVEKIKERHTMHTRTVTHTRADGTTYTTTETYWTWDQIDSERKSCKKISFCGVEFDNGLINLPSSDYIDTVYESPIIRYKYYGTDKEFTGTIFTELKEETISDNSNFYNNQTIEETTEFLHHDGGLLVLFWFFWIILIGFCVYAFYYFDNRWLE